MKTDYTHASMQLTSSDLPCLLPDPSQRTVLQLGLVPLTTADWIQCDADFVRFHAHKQECYSRHAGRVGVERPDSKPAQSEFARFLLANLQRWHSHQYRVEPDRLTHLDSGLTWSLEDLSLRSVSHWIQEDICLLEPEAGHFVLTAASVCSPSNWRLEEKLGCSLDAIHAPVPGYAGLLADRVNRLLTNLKPEKPLSRFNWSVQSGNELLWRDDIGTTATGSDALFWRIERQSLLRIPGSEVIVFSIRIYLHSFTDLVKMPGFRANLHTIIEHLPPAQRVYKGLANRKF